MPKRIVIAVAVLALVGVGGYVLSQPRKGTVEYHKSEYFRAREDSKFRNTARLVWSKISRRTSEPSQERIDRMDEHYDALIRLGYLREQVFVVSNRTGPEVLDVLRFVSHRRAFPNDIWGLNRLRDVGTNTITVSGPTDEMAQWEQAIREADVPEEKTHQSAPHP